MAKSLLFELGTEEIPASFIDPALEQLKAAIVSRLADAHLQHGEVQVFSTPRRLAVLVHDVAEVSQDTTRDVVGPPTRAAFDKDGKPTKAAERFAEGLGVGLDRLARVTTPKGEYLGVTLTEKGKPAAEILGPVLFAAVHELKFPKSMRWGDVETSFARPLHWIVALLGGEVLPVVFGDVKSGRTTYGHRFLSPAAIQLEDPAGYEAVLQKAGVVADGMKRKALLLERVRAAAQTAGGRVLEDESLVEQIKNLVELPNPVVGSFDARHLDLPPEVLVQEMKSHQRYFSVTDASGALLPKFIAVSNTPVRDEQLSLRGYERVLRARLADARFFFDEDRRTPLMDRVERLHRVVWQGKLGSYAEKTDRIRALASFAAKQARQEGELGTIERAATLCKADLVTGMVGEFPELQGVMGREYAKADGEPKEVALAIFEHYLPRNAADSLPTQHAGALLGIGDRLDTLSGIFALGKGPTGAADPFGLRRACLAIIHLVLAKGYRLSLSAAIDEALRLLQPKLGGVKQKGGEASPKQQILEFFRARLKALWTEKRQDEQSPIYRADVVEAVLSIGFDDLVASERRLRALSQIVGRQDFAPLAVAFKRVVNIVEKQGKDVPAGPSSRDKMAEPAETQLHAASVSAREKVASLVAQDDFAGALKEITALKPAVDAFFEGVMVMAEDKALRENRIRLLLEIGSLFDHVADFAKIQAEI